MVSYMHTLTKFAKSKWSLVIYKNNKPIFKSQARALKPLIGYLKSSGFKKKQIIVFDQNIGRAAALLLSLVKPIKVYTPLISEGGLKVFEKHEIDFEAKKQIKYLMGAASRDMCQWEKLSQGKTASEFWYLVKNS